MAAATITNRPYIESVVKLSRHLFADIAIKARIIKDGENAQLTLFPVKHAEYKTFPEKYHEDEWNEEVYSSSDHIEQLWIGFYHMIQERGEGRIFGCKYTEGDLMSRLRAVHTDYIQGNPVDIFLSDLYIADEFNCDVGPGNVLSSACHVLRNLANDEGQITYNGPWQPDSVNIVVDGENVNVTQFMRGFYRAEPDGADDSVVDAVLNAAQATNLQLRGVGLDHRLEQFAQIEEFRNSFSWEVSVSDFAAIAGEDSEATRHYSRLARLAHEMAFRRAKEALVEIGVDEEDMLKWVWDYCGEEAGLLFASFASDGLARGIAGDMTWSGMTGVDEMVDEDEPPIEGRITAQRLRDFGRLGFTDNVVLGVPSEGGRRLLSAREDGVWITVAESPGQVVPGHIEDSVVIR